MQPHDPWHVVQQFNDCITAGDADGLAQLMTADHAFIDSAGTAWRGRQACAQTWSGFFAAFPGYRNVFTMAETRSESVVVRGYSVCSAEPALDGPAIWTAVVRGGKVAEWHVHEDTAEVRARLGLS
ncbi:nuclear transport factor 2 family protein [Ornithinicoccus halotolerans]|uniref:nuclear transport factor 2 family protein n=1 Tax=Ornithinicoccus halotolerans TaxID=1748220 RepID=UPI001E4FB8DC|nr:nuclear transport factor 2 family protein [Ornithinicoccus halotolerans]